MALITAQVRPPVASPLPVGADGRAVATPSPHRGRPLHAASVHYGAAAEIRAMCVDTSGAAYAANPARFHHRRPSPPKLSTVAWIDEPTPEGVIKSV